MNEYEKQRILVKNRTDSIKCPAHENKLRWKFHCRSNCFQRPLNDHKEENELF